MLLPLFKGGVMLAVIGFAFGLGMGCGQPIVTMLMFSHSAEGRSGEALGLRMTANHLTRLIGPVMFGSIGSAFGLSPVFWVNALMLGTGGALSRPRDNGVQPAAEDMSALKRSNDARS
jgi:MFS family permease